jgi:CHAT domain-containing protein/tetratricopeptide (TPR) repeat protein
MTAIAFVIVALVGAAPAQQAKPTDAGDAWRIVRSAQAAVETGTEARYEREWTAAVSKNPSDRRALLAFAALAQQRYQYERADSLYDRIIRLQPAGSQYTAAAHVSMALWRAIGSDVVRADSLFMQARAEDLRAGDWHIAFQALVNVGKLRSRRAGPKVGLELLREARSISTNPIPDERAQLLCTEGLFMEQAGDTTGRSRLADGIRVARNGNAFRELGICDVGLATVLERSGSFYEAERAAAEAVQIFERIHFPYGAGSASQWLGYARLTRGYFVTARADLERAVRDARLARFTQTEAWARTDLADLYFALGDAESARVQAERASALHSSYGDLWGLAVDVQFEGFVAESRGSFDEACAKYMQSVAAFGRAGLTFNAVGSLKLLAIAQMRAGRLDSAQRALDEGTRLARASANSGWQVELPVYRARLAMLRGDLLTADSLLAVARPNFNWRSGDQVNLQTMPFAALEAQLALREHRVATADSAVGYLSAAIALRRRVMSNDDLRAGLAQLRGDWGGLSDAYPELVAGLVDGGRLPSAFRFIESVRAREVADVTLRTLGRMSDSAAALAGFRRMAGSEATVGIDEVRRRLSTDEALVEFTLGEAGAPTTAIIITNDTAMAVSLADRKTVAPLIDRYLRVASTGVEPVALSRQLGAALLQPIVRALPSRVGRLSISPDGDLYRVPFDGLRLADDHFAVERYAISIVPSATVGMALRGVRTPATATRLLAIGDPAFARERDGGATFARVELRADAPTADSAARFREVSLARLPRSADEANRVGRYGVRSVVLTRANASEAAVRSLDWRDVAVAHFATHALVDGEGQARTALALAPSAGDDGFLTPAEVATLRFNGALVVLSACETLGGQILGGEGLRGLVGPMFEAGARTVVVTHWSIGDRTVLPFVDRFYANMAAGRSVGDALRQTKLAAIRDGARISDWAAFTVIGDASMTPPLRRANLPPLAWLRDAAQTTRDTSGGKGTP